MLFILCNVWCYSKIVVGFFFFFKQKTAYELRISDWSSDVCSSDLCLLPSGGCCDNILHSRHADPVARQHFASGHDGQDRRAAYLLQLHIRCAGHAADDLLQFLATSDKRVESVTAELDRYVSTDPVNKTAHPTLHRLGKLLLLPRNH